MDLTEEVTAKEKEFRETVLNPILKLATTGIPEEHISDVKTIYMNALAYTIETSLNRLDINDKYRSELLVMKKTLVGIFAELTLERSRKSVPVVPIEPKKETVN